MNWKVNGWRRGFVRSSSDGLPNPAFQRRQAAFYVTRLTTGERAMNIKDVARISRLPAETIRYYEDTGPVRPGRAANGCRRFARPDLHTLAVRCRRRGPDARGAGPLAILVPVRRHRAIPPDMASPGGSRTGRGSSQTHRGTVPSRRNTPSRRGLPSPRRSPRRRSCRRPGRAPAGFARHSM